MKLFSIRVKKWFEPKPPKSESTGRWLPPENILGPHFEKYLHDMDLKLTEHVRNTISLLYKQISGWKYSDIWNFLAKKNNSGVYFAENRHFQVGHVLLRHCDVMRWPIFIILVSMERRDPTLYYGTNQLLYFGHVNFKFTGGQKTPTP